METRTMEQIYQQIANILIDIIPEDWEKVYVYAEVREGYKKVLFYYYPLNAEEPVYSLDIADIFNINEDEFDKKEEQLYDCFTELKKEFKNQGQEEWSSLTFILDNTGRMKLSYDYKDLSQISPVEKQEKWENAYLK